MSAISNTAAIPADEPRRNLVVANPDSHDGGSPRTNRPGLTSGNRKRGHIAKEWDESFGHRWMSKDCVA